MHWNNYNIIHSTISYLVYFRSLLAHGSDRLLFAYIDMFLCYAIQIRQWYHSLLFTIRLTKECYKYRFLIGGKRFGLDCKFMYF